MVEAQKSGQMNGEEEKELLKLNIELNYMDPNSNPLTPDMMQTSSVKELHELVDLTRNLVKSIKGE